MYTIFTPLEYKEENIVNPKSKLKLALFKLVLQLSTLGMMSYLFYTNWNLQTKLGDFFIWMLLGGTIQGFFIVVPLLVYMNLVLKDGVFSGTEFVVGLFTVTPLTLYTQYKIFQYFLL